MWGVTRGRRRGGRYHHQDAPVFAEAHILPWSTCITRVSATNIWAGGLCTPCWNPSPSQSRGHPNAPCIQVDHAHTACTARAGAGERDTARLHRRYDSPDSSVFKALLGQKCPIQSTRLPHHAAEYIGIDIAAFHSPQGYPITQASQG